MEYLKAELHCHSFEDPYDDLAYPATVLIDRLAEQGFQVVALTLHGKQHYTKDLRSYAEERDITLIPGVEAFIEGKHTLLYNFDFDPTRIRTFADVRHYKTPESMVIAPHPFYPQNCCLWSLVDRHADLFDAIEYCHFYSKELNFFNQLAERKANKLGLPMVGTSDVHSLHQVGRTYSVIRAERNVEAIIDAVKCGRVEVVSNPLSLPHLLVTTGEILAEHARRFYRGLAKGKADSRPAI